MVIGKREEEKERKSEGKRISTEFLGSVIQEGITKEAVRGYLGREAAAGDISGLEENELSPSKAAR